MKVKGFKDGFILQFMLIASSARRTLLLTFNSIYHMHLFSFIDIQGASTTLASNCCNDQKQNSFLLPS